MRKLRKPVIYLLHTVRETKVRDPDLFTGSWITLVEQIKNVINSLKMARIKQFAS